MGDFWSQFFEMYYEQDENFVDVRRFSWFADFHEFIKPWVGAAANRVFKELLDKRAQGEQFREGVIDFRAYVEAIKELGVKLDDDSHISPKLTGFETDETTRVTGRHLQHLKSLELQQLPEGRLLEPIHRRPKRQAQENSSENPTVTTVQDDTEGAFDGVQFGSAHNVSVEPHALASTVATTAEPDAVDLAAAIPEVNAVATTSTVPQDDIPAPEALKAAPARPTSSEQTPATSTPLPNAITPQRRRGNQRGARGLLGSVMLKKGKKRAEIAAQLKVPTAAIKDDHPLMLDAFPPSIPTQTPTKHPRSLSADLESSRTPKSLRRNEHIEDSANRHDRDVENGSERSRRADAKAIKAQSPVRDVEIPVEHRVLDPISFLLTDDFISELPFAGLKEHSPLFSGFATVADVHQPRNMQRQPLTKVAMWVLLCRMVDGLISPCHLGTWQEHFDYVVATIVFRAEELEIEALRGFRAFWREPFMYTRALGSALT